MHRLPGLAAALALVVTIAGCSSAEHPWPDTPEDLQPIDAPTAETVVDVLTIGARAAAGDEFDLEEKQVLDLGDAEPSEVIEAYRTQLEPQWEDQEVLSGSIGRVWQRDDQRFTVMLTEVDGTSTLVTIASRRD